MGSEEWDFSEILGWLFGPWISLLGSTVNLIIIAVVHGHGKFVVFLARIVFFVTALKICCVLNNNSILVGDSPRLCSDNVCPLCNSYPKKKKKFIKTLFYKLWKTKLYFSLFFFQGKKNTKYMPYAMFIAIKKKVSPPLKKKISTCLKLLLNSMDFVNED